ncbi:hypothetical protein HYALB_00006273 [Hymenoscyphus albidus]|uniref:NAD-dependent epimerase/dehydratase domain-containing protein n=1 Tax=Hymenoscyphus albidus TaxID=595503 RepID=A0A9N9LZ34_9HELO|nr:hypothetical protein HYALB_00006273 [Hymenoscyphus albidus]
MAKHTAPRTVLVTGANGYIGSAISRSFVRAGWKTYGLICSQKHASALSYNDMIPVLGSFNDPSFPFLTKLNEEGVVFDVVISTTEQLSNYIPHYNAIIPLLHKVVELTKDSDKLATSPGLRPHTESSLLNSPKALRDRANYAMRAFHHGDAFDAAVIRPTNV